MAQSSQVVEARVFRLFCFMLPLMKSWGKQNNNHVEKYFKTGQWKDNKVVLPGRTRDLPRGPLYKSSHAYEIVNFQQT